MTFRQSMSWMHTWTGLLLAWVLYFMFITGAASYYDTEIDRWMKPEQPAPVAVTETNTTQLFEIGVAHALAEVPQADSYFIRIPTSRSYSPYVAVNWSTTDADGKTVRGSAELDGEGELIPKARETGGGQALYRMHWTFHYIPRDVGLLLAGLAAFFMLSAIITGIVIHKKIFVDFFTMRPGKGQRTWLDSHNVISVMTLPYQFVITYSGLVFLMTSYFPLIIAGQYGVGPDVARTFQAEVYGARENLERAGEPAPLTDLAPLIAQTRAILGDEALSRVSLTNPGDASARVSVHGSIDDGLQRNIPSVTFNGVTGELISVQPRASMNARATNDVIEGLHEALFAGPVLRAAFFVSAVMGAGMIATGLVLWTKKRRQKLRGDEQAGRGLVVVERLNVGVIAGLALGVAAYFWANRLLPLGMADRAAWEMHTLFLVWGAAIAHGAIRRPRQAWREQLWCAAVLAGLIPVLNALTTPIHLGATLPLPGRAGDWALAGVDVWILVIASGMGYAAWIASKPAAAKPQALAKKLKRTPPSEVAAQPGPAE